MKTLVIILSCLFIFFAGESQQLIAEFPITRPMVQNIRGMTVGDSLFLMYDEALAGEVKERRAYLVGSNSGPTSLDLSEIGKKQLCGVLENKDSLYFYYFEDLGKEVGIRSIARSRSSGEKRHHQHEIILPGELIGSYVDSLGLKLICASKKEYAISIVTINGHEIIERSDIKIPVHLVKTKKSQVQYIDENEFISPFEARSKMKLYRSKGNLILLLDEPYDEYAKYNPPAVKTSAYFINLNTKSVEPHSFFTNERAPFTSWYHNGRIYRCINGSYQTLEVYGKDAGKILFSNQVTYKPTSGQFLSYLRHGNQLTVKKGDYTKTGSSFLPMFIVVDSMRSGVVITLGTQSEIRGMFPSMIPGAGLGVAVASAVAASAIKDAINWPFIDNYMYFDLIDTSLQVNNDALTIRRVIDDYEIEQDIAGVKYQYKAYIGSNCLVFGIYREKSSKTIKVVKFVLPGRKKPDQ